VVRIRRIGGIAIGVVAFASGVVIPVTILSRSPHTKTLDATEHGCASNWQGGSSGEHVFLFRNRTKVIEDILLFGPDHRAVYARARRIAPGTTVRVQADLPPGTYAWECSSLAGIGTVSLAANVTGPPVADAHPMRLISVEDLVNADYVYRDKVTTGLGILAGDTDSLLAAVRSASRPAAEAAWLVAHLDFARLGAAYDTFGDRTAAIDGRADGLPGGASGPGFTGFGRLERGLWNGGPMASLLPVASRLVDDVHGLVREFPHDLTPQGDPPLRAHEILENGLQFELTGQTDRGSHTNLATLRADVDATRMVLAALSPLLSQVDPDRQRLVTNDLERVAGLLDAQHHADGSWTPVGVLASHDRAAINAAVDGALEDLAPIPDLLTPTDDTT
jgi:iron uptake system EfeUOB component EfeO/EfeM